MGIEPGLSLRFAEVTAKQQAMELLVWLAVDQPDLTAEGFEPCLEQQWDHQHHHRGCLEALQLLLEALPHQGMDQLFQPPAFNRVVEHDPSQFGSVQCRRITDDCAKPLRNSECTWAVGCKRIPGEAVRIEHRPAAILKQASHRAFAAGDATGQADASLHVPEEDGNSLSRRRMHTSWTPVSGGVTAPQGFRAAGLAVGLKASGNPDLALLLAPAGAVCAGVFTTSVVRAACVDLCSERLASSGGRVRSVLINSGQANACTGDRGLIDSQRATAAMADRLGLDVEEVLICSTGVIGVPIPMPTLLAGLDPLATALTETGGNAAAKAILTTDLVEKQVALEADFDGRRVCIGGMAKGSGMIHPDMATMLGFFCCDAGVEASLWQAMVRRAANRSFNAITVDGDTSTNDTVLAFAAGESLAEDQLGALEQGLTTAMQQLAQAIARDGEGATCLIEVQVEGAADDVSALCVARTVCGSSLVKTAVHGRDPNWGRIVAAAGRSGVMFDPEAVALWIGGHQLMQAGQPVAFDRDAASASLREDTVVIRLRLGSGPGFGVGWGCDLSDQYIRINADYTT